MSNLRLKTAAEKRRLILDSAGALFDRFGPLKTSVADIARESGMSPANIYNFFESRDAIHEALGHERLSHLRTTILEQIDDLDTSWAAITAIFTLTALDIRKHLENEKDVLQLQAIERKNRWQFVEDFHEFIRLKLEELIRSGTRSGEFGPVDARWAASALFDCLIVAVDPLLLWKVEANEHLERIGAQLGLLRRALR